jgi:hypothetical protein
MEFLDTVNQMSLDAIDEDIKDHLLDQWINTHADEGPEYIEHGFMMFAGPELQKQYNEYYKLTKDDDFYFEVGE